MHNQAIVIFCSTSTSAEAHCIARQLIDSKLAGCVNIMPESQSVYYWEGHVQTENECILKIKTTQAHFQAIEQLIVKLHSYDVPEIIAVPIINSSEPYLSWLQNSVGS